MPAAVLDRSGNSCIIFIECPSSWKGTSHEVWGKYDLSFDLGEPERYRKDVPEAQVHVLDAGHFALDTAPDEIAALVRNFVGSSVGDLRARRAG